MWLAPMAQLLVLAAAGSADDPAKLPEPIATRQTVFSIPFRIDRAGRQSHEPVEVRLYVSADLGASWRMYDRIDPAQGYFVFRAPGDGQYWFAVRTLDRSNRLWPQKVNAPELRVVVDTVPPKLELQARCGQAGQIIAQWKIVEPHFKSDSLTVQYRTVPDGQWQSVATDRRADRVCGAVENEETTWWPPADASAVEIRVEAADWAGNLAVTHDQVKLDHKLANRPNRDARAASNTRPEVAPETGQPFSRWRAATAVSSPLRWSTANHVSPAVRNRYAAPGGQAARTGGQGSLAGERPRMVNSRVFQLEYDAGAAGPAGTSCVELWGTRDGGQTWSRLGLDDDNRSPLRVSVNEEGIYGFRVVIHDDAGLASRPPEPGDVPDAWIGVDLTKPAAKITSVTQGTGEEAGQLIIRWEASDANLANQPVRLSFSGTPDGPWSTIASGLKNTGLYGWSLDGRMPEKIYLCLEVRDAAGNLGVFETSSAISLDRFGPAANLNKDRSLARPTRESSRRYSFR